MNTKNTQGLLDFNAYRALIRAIQDKEKNLNQRAEMLDLVKDAMTSGLTYVNCVDEMEVQIPYIYAKYEGEEILFRVQNMDQARRHAHDAAVANAQVLNRMADHYGVSPVFLGDTEDRYQVAVFCLDVVAKLFAHRKV